MASNNEKKKIDLSNVQGYVDHASALYEMLMNSDDFDKCTRNIRDIIGLLCDLNYHAYRELKKVQD